MSFVPFCYVHHADTVSCVVTLLLLTFLSFFTILHASARTDELCGDSFAAHLSSFVPSCMRQPN